MRQPHGRERGGAEGAPEAAQGAQLARRAEGAREAPGEGGKLKPAGQGAQHAAGVQDAAADHQLRRRRQ